MNLKDLFEMQQIMENKIKEITDIDENALGDENTVHLRFLALQVKVGELANLTKCYKYQMVKENLPKDKVLFRYLDAIKYLLSIGNRYEFNIINLQAFERVPKTDNVIELFADLYDGISLVKKNINGNNFVDALNAYILVFAKFINLGEVLGLTFDEAFAYYENYKNAC